MAPLPPLPSVDSLPLMQRTQTSYTPEIMEDIATRLAAGEGLATICRTQGYPDRRTVLSWTQSIPGVGLRYAHARREGLDAMAESIIDIADDLTEDPNSRRIRVDARKWVLSKLQPDKYGDRVAVEHSVGESVADVLRRRRAQVMADGCVTLPATIVAPVAPALPESE